jgi:hypothetical protein
MKKQTKRQEKSQVTWQARPKDEQARAVLWRKLSGEGKAYARYLAKKGPKAPDVAHFKKALQGQFEARGIPWSASWSLHDSLLAARDHGADLDPRWPILPT